MIIRNSPQDAELRLQPLTILVFVAMLGVVMFFVGQILNCPLSTLEYTLYSSYVFSLLAWTTMQRWPKLGRWPMLPPLLNLVVIVTLWLGPPGLLAAVVFPVILAVPIIAFSAALLTALLESVLLIVNITLNVVPLTSMETIIALVAIWSMTLIAHLVEHRVHQLGTWLVDYFEREHALIEADRDYRLERSQLLEDLLRANEQLSRSNQLVNHLRRQADEARLAKEEFVANVSHELRTPLNMITGFSETMLQAPGIYGEIPTTMLADLTVIHRNAQHLSDLINDVLALSQADARQMVLSLEEVQFEEMINDAIIAVRPLFEVRGLFSRTEIDSDLPRIECDRTRIREVLLNLLSNAGRFTQEGGVTLSAKQESSKLRVTVSDTGIGIEPQAIEKLFQPFQQVDGSIRRRYGGTGLGLSISKRFIELHKGTIWVDSEKGVGTSFVFELPVSSNQSHYNDPVQHIDPRWEFMQRTRPSRTPKAKPAPRFVIMESGNTLQSLLTQYVAPVNIEVVSTLEQAFQSLAKMPAQALVVNDLFFSHSLTRLLETKLPEGIPAIVCSIPQRGRPSTQIGVSEYLVKPVSRQSLLNTLEDLEIVRGTILIVDDEPDALQLFGRIMNSAESDYRLLFARDGLEALEILEEHLPAAILMDLMMPRLNGFQLLEMIKQNVEYANIPVIALSARDPSGQPIISTVVSAVTSSGISGSQMLKIIGTLSEILSALEPSGAQVSPRVSID